MATIQGRGLCEIPNEEGLPCASQIQDGEAHGSVYVNKRYLQGHKRCADSFYSRKASRESNERMTGMVQRMNQDGPGGAVDFPGARDALETGAVPVETPEPAAAMLADLPMDATPEEAVAYATKGVDFTSVTFADSKPIEFNTVRPTPGPRSLDERISEVRKRREGGAQRHVDHEVNGVQQERMSHIRTLGSTLEAAIATLAPASPEREQAQHYVDLAVMCANAAIARHA